MERRLCPKPNFFHMKKLKPFVAATLIAGVLMSVTGCKTENNTPATVSSPTAAVRPYPLNKCIVSDEALEAGKAYTFVRNGQEIKLCCKDCLADFDKDPAKYLAKLK